MNQHSLSLWNAAAPIPPLDSLRDRLSADVAIIGAGITGLTAALLLAERGMSVVVLEREQPGSGETGNTTAHLTVAVDAGYHQLERRYGAGDAAAIADASSAALDKIEELVERLGISCRFRSVPAYAFTEKESDVARLQAEAVAARTAGLNARWVDSVPLPFPTHGGVLFASQAQFHPREYLLGLLAAAIARGVRVFGGSAVRSIERGETASVAVTDEGRVQAGAVFMATNVPIDGFTSVHTLTAAYRSYAIAVDASAHDPEGLFWDADDPYHYVRVQETGEGTFLITGGGDHRVGEEPEMDPFAEVESWTTQRFGPRPVRYRWSGQIIEPHGGIPLIGGSDGIYISTGYSGQGMTFGTLGAMIVADLIAGAENPWAELFDPSRMLPHVATKELITENAHVPAHLAADRLADRDVEPEGAESIAPGCGKVVRMGGRKVAASRDETGALRVVSSVCTHLGCDVAWNREERTWDCPCHGSRFDTEGKVLNGPAHQPLESIDVSTV